MTIITMECQSEVSKAPFLAICDIQSDAESAVHTRPTLDIGFTTPQKSYSAPFCGSYCTPECDDAIRPAIGMTFADLNAAKEFYEAYAHHVGFSVRVGQQKTVNGVVTHKCFYCDREGFREERKDIGPPEELYTCQKLQQSTFRSYSSWSPKLKADKVSSNLCT
ncbi:uncharacterized protein LOC119279896 [Triticum dicoccoides]|uniref:uncharacterized protein LOC119279896 n=1 Tax=Triticum dicoccoides TaxID=85692 RepID=UPI00188EBC61|nr:uncharacterized protein LOC119279896 [Triticum dicoccoides]